MGWFLAARALGAATVAAYSADAAAAPLVGCFDVGLSRVAEGLASATASGLEIRHGDPSHMYRSPAVRRSIIADTPPFQALALTAATVAVLTLARWLFDRGDGGMQFAPYFPFILLAALFFGWRIGAVASLLSAVAANRLLRPEPVLFYVDRQDAVMFAFFCGSCALLVYIGEMLRRLVRELEEAKQREAVLGRELLHRSKNTLTIVNALAALTRRKSSLQDFFPAFSGRVQALGRATDLLVNDEAGLRQIDHLIEHAIAPFRADGNFRLKVIACEIPQASCIPLMLLLHELCTNAVKHGALTMPDGVVVIECSVTSDPAAILLLRWREDGGPPIEAPVVQGLGSALLRAQNGLSRVDFRLPVGGAECDIEVEGVRCGGAR